MKHNIFFVALVLALLMIALAMLDASASAKSADTYTIDWYTIDGGGTMSASSGTFTLSGTLGQADAGTLSGGAYTLIGGFWADFLGNRLNLPLIMR